jgi:porphobilinogen synthase
MLILSERPRRNRRTEALRGLVKETHLPVSHLVSPLFVCEGVYERQPIQSLPGVYRLSLDQLIPEALALWNLGCRAFLLFAHIPDRLKNAEGSEALNPTGLLPEAIRRLREALPDACLFSDIALDPYTDHGHDGLLHASGEVLNDATVEKLAEMALHHAAAGVSMVAPSDMMDGRVGALRQALDKENYQEVGILSYTAKYASALYGPFRELLGSQLKGGHKRSYQMAPSNRREACREAHLDQKEGADILMVKPATFYLDVISDLKKSSSLPIAAYHVSGEYAMVMAAAAHGFLQAPAVLAESLLAIRRAGADLIVTYACCQIERLLPYLEG